MFSGAATSFVHRIVARPCGYGRPSLPSFLSVRRTSCRRDPPLRAQHVRPRRDASTLGILRETYDPWERRAPLTPENVRNLLHTYRGNDGHEDGLRILVQPCRRRCYSDQLYESAGAIVSDDLSSAQVLLGVKRPHYDLHENLDAAMRSLRGKTVVLFSHVVKGQLDNMEFLQLCLDNHVQLLDYERMVSCDASEQQEGGGHDQPARPPRRLVAFGRFAGMAGAVDSFAAIGKRLLYSPEHGVSTPFLTKVPPSWMHDDVEAAKASVRHLGESIRRQGLPDPLVFAVTGQGGCVHGGVMEILQLLPHHLVSVSDLPMLYQRFKTSLEANHHSAVSIVPVSLSDSFERVDDGSFDRQDFQQNPEQYRSMFAKRVAPFVNVIFNCVYWDARFPRLLTKAQTKHIYEVHGPKTRLFHVSDISCDLNGSIEVWVCVSPFDLGKSIRSAQSHTRHPLLHLFANMQFLDRTTTIESPFYQYDPVLEKEVASGVGDQGVTVMGVDILPTELPKDSSDHFGRIVETVVVPELVAAVSQSDQGVDPTRLSPRLVRDSQKSSSRVTRAYPILCPVASVPTDERLYHHLHRSAYARVSILGCAYKASPRVSPSSIVRTRHDAIAGRPLVRFWPHQSDSQRDRAEPRNVGV